MAIASSAVPASAIPYCASRRPESERASSPGSVRCSWARMSQKLTPSSTTVVPTTSPA